MSTLHVRDFPDDLYEALRRQAKERGTSISKETIRLLKRAVRLDRAEVRRLLEEVETYRPSARGVRAGAAPLIRNDRDRR